MVKVLVIGASGYIGLRAVQHLRRADHIVYGATRSASSTLALTQEEAIPVVGTVQDWIKAIEDHAIDTVVDFSGDFQGYENIIQPILSKAAKSRESRYGNKLNYIYISGVWLHGSGSGYIDELTPTGVQGVSPNQPPPLVAWRPDLERRLLKHSDDANILILRPSLVYGGSGNALDLYFSQIYAQVQASVDKPIQLAAKPDLGLSLVHVDDVGSAVAAAVGKIELVASSSKDISSRVLPVFDLTTVHESASYIFQRVAKILGHKTGQIEFQPLPEEQQTDLGSLFTVVYNTNVVHGANTRAQSLLDWRPLKTRGLAVDAEVYVQAWLAGFLAKQQKV
ncbi:hypothetical protein BG004_004954 [Podila humilis]|nr:hypothetical protein BG004_004954 [Podila humilis]